MSKLLSSNDLGDAQTVAIGSLGQTGGGGAFRARFADGQEVFGARRGAVEEKNAMDPLEQARADAFAEGFDAGMRVARESAEEDQQISVQLAQALEQMVPAVNGALSTLLSSAVLRLVTQIVGEAAVDHDVLMGRVEAVGAFLEEAQAQSCLHLHPDDIALLDGSEVGFTLSPDASIARGSVRLQTADGWIEDGPDVQLYRLQAMLDDMEGRA